MILNDIDIRKPLINFLNKKVPKPLKIIEELRVHNGNAIADIVTVHKTMHCYEIKGDNDNIYRAIEQGNFYNKSFPKITLVTTEKYANTSVNKIPHFWGIIIVSHHNGNVNFRYLRKAKYNPLMEKKSALLSLWKDELIDIANELSVETIRKSFNREKYADEISKSITFEKLQNCMSSKIANRTLKVDW